MKFLKKIVFLLTPYIRFGYPVYAEIFQKGILYEGETRFKYFSEYLLYIIFPVNMLLSIGSVVLVEYFSKIYK
jgi:hypothetical protein